MSFYKQNGGASTIGLEKVREPTTMRLKSRGDRNKDNMWSEIPLPCFILFPKSKWVIKKFSRAARQRDNVERSFANSFSLKRLA